MINMINKHCAMACTQTELNKDLKFEIWSYDTHVADVFVKGKDKYEVKRKWYGYSATTMRDINTCLQRLNIEHKITKKEWEEM